MASLKTIAEQSGVSKTTVSFVLNGRGDEKNISTETQRRIQDTAKRLNYQPNQLARSLSMGRSYTIGFVVPDISNPFFGKIARLVEQYANEKAYSVMIASTDEEPSREKKILESFQNRQIDGVIIAPTSSQSLHTPIPLVSFDRVFADQVAPYVDVNNKETATLLTQQLIDAGNKRIGLVSLTSHLPNINQRIEGYKQALSANAMVLDQELVKEIDFKNKKADVKVAIEALLGGSSPVTAVLFLNNVLAAEGVWVVNRYFPESVNKLKFASFDNLDVFDYALPKVTSALQPSKSIAKRCVEVLLQQIEDKSNAEDRCFSTKIIER